VIPFWVALAGGVGAMSRFVTDGAVTAAIVVRRDPSTRRLGALPVPIMLINVVGSFLLGLFTGMAAYHGWTSSSRLVLGTGFCGGFTTFSTASFETFRLLQARRWWPAALSGAGTLGLTMLAAEAGLLVAQL
jgi:CrcB protein